jgi:hypothetical protein
MVRSSHLRTACCVAVALVLACAPVAVRAQFDPSSLKKKVEKAVSSQVDEKTKSAPVLLNGDEPEEVIEKAARALRPLLDMRSVYKGMLSQRSNAQEFYNNCRDADYATQRSRVTQAVALKPDARSRNESSFDAVMVRFPAHFEKLVKEQLIPEINNAIETAYAEKTKGTTRAGAALDAAESALLVADGILLVTPDDEKVKKLRGDAQKAAASMGAAKEAVFTSAFGKTNAGRIVFSSSPITAGSEQPAAMRTSFTTRDNIYGMMYFKGTFKEVTGGSGYGWTKLFVDDNEKASYDFKLPADQVANTWLKSEIIPDPAESTTRGAALFTKAISELSPRPHTIRVQTLDENWKVLAEGEFELDCSEGLDRIADVHRKLGEKKIASATLPAAAMKNPALEKECMAALKDWKEKPLKVIITDRDWTIHRNPITGVIVSRTINTTTVVKKPDGGCRMFQVSYEQMYNGKSYGKAQQYGVGDSADISCDKVK